MGFPGKVKFPIISNHFAKCAHKGELSAVFSAIYYLKICLYQILKIHGNFFSKIRYKFSENFYFTGLYTPKDSDSNFKTKLNRLRLVLQSQEEIYKNEQRALEVGF